MNSTNSSFLNTLCDKFDFKSNFLYNNLSLKEINQIKNSMENVTFRKKDLLFYEGGIPTGVYFIEEGRAKKYKTLFKGEKQIFYIYKKGDLLGYHALLCEERNVDSCEALESCEIKFISSERFFNLLNSIPTFRANIIKNMSHEFGVMANIMALLAQKSQAVRLAVFLLLFHNRFNINNEHKFGLELPREDFANVVGTSRERLARLLKDFKENNWIYVEQKKIYIRDMASLINVVRDI